MNINSLLDKCREVCGVRTDAELAQRLRVSKQALSGWRNGHRLPDAVTCATIAGLTGESLARVIGIVEEARAISPKEKAVWRRLAATASLIGCLALYPLDQVHAATLTGADKMHYAKLRRVLVFIRRVFRWRHDPAAVLA